MRPAGAATTAQVLQWIEALTAAFLAHIAAEIDRPGQQDLAADCLVALVRLRGSIEDEGVGGERVG